LDNVTPHEGMRAVSGPVALSRPTAVSGPSLPRARVVTGAPGVGGAHTAHARHARFLVAPIRPTAAKVTTTYSAWRATLSRMRVRELLVELQRLPRDLEVLAFEAGCENYCEREVDELELQGGQVYLHLGVRRDEPPRR
jgi:hypothetical protein